MDILISFTGLLGRLNTHVLKIAQSIAMVLLAFMVFFILYQVVLRYFFNAAPNWTEEAARFLMLWMTGLIAPCAYRAGGFVAIDLTQRKLIKFVSRLLVLALLILSFIVVYKCVQLGWDNIHSLSAGGRSASLKIPLEWIGGKNIYFKNSYAYTSLFVGFCLLFLVNIELILHQIIKITGHEDKIAPICADQGTL